nr:MAG TPA: hypothetical protein [Caudoviricetes sp.]DAY78881.1 MAG TPA: hypothetical protein [Caudoviricetes sp.]
MTEFYIDLKRHWCREFPVRYPNIQQEIPK